ncbi:hypothetical protein PYCH_00310 [Pyrococcus yayanosii CH1]|uniref:AAA+ ATPase domain-containing protein n=2 Tax=Pyrococcus TaxID=2260 RepID=F8AFD7_PYRYC|nr:hypothetical protein PYCH_00310 [Pyrococcus yayanosii CH1]
MVSDSGILELANIIQSLKEKYKDEWKKYEKEALSKFEELSKYIFKDNPPIEEIMKLINGLPPKIRAMLYFMHAYKKEDITEKFKRMFSDQKDQKFRKVLKDVEDKKDIKSLDLKELKENIREIDISDVGLSIISTWLTVVNPYLFIPVHKGVISDKFNSLLERLFGFKLVWGRGGWKDYVNNYLKFVQIVNKVKNELNVETTLELAFYLSKFSTEELGVMSSKNISSQEFTLHNYLILRGYLYPSHLVAQFYVALKTKGFVILSGLTGAGKTKIVQELAELLNSSGENFLFLSVRPDWRDSKALLGYYNPLTGRYHRTKLLDFILKAKEDYERNGRNAVPYFILLDEMNLAHVEYYFADFLSVLESGRDEGGFTREGIKLHDVDEVETFDGIPKELHLPPNLYVIGTVNMDETTYAFSPKVLDRAFTIEFHDVKLEDYPPRKIELSRKEIEELRSAILKDLRRGGKFLAWTKEETNEAVRELREGYEGLWNALRKLNEVLEPYDLHFGYRVIDEIALFFRSARESQELGIVKFGDDDEIFDLALLMKVLPKFHGNRKKLEGPLKEVLKLCMKENEQIIVKFRKNGEEEVVKLPDEIDRLDGNVIVTMITNWSEYEKHFRFKHTAKKVLRMLRQLYEIGFASFS